MKIKEFILKFVQKTETNIESLEQFKELTGEQRKERLDTLLKSWCLKTVDTLGCNFIIKFAIKKLVIDNIPLLTQVIFDLIKTRINGITEVWIKDNG